MDQRIEGGAIINPRDLAIPKETFRPGQLEAINEAYDCPQPVVLIDGPTGCGKSVIGKGLMGRAYADTSAGRKPGRSILTTKTIQLQDQYTEDFPDLVRMVGRSNFACIEGYEDAAAAPCATITGVCPHEGLNSCDFYRARNSAIAAAQLVGNNDYLVAAFRGTSKVLHDRPLWVADEGHLLDESLRAASGVDLSSSTLWSVQTRTGLNHPANLADFPAWRAWAVNAQEELRDAARAFATAAHRRDVAAVKRLRPAKRAYDTCTALIDALDSDRVLFRTTPAGLRLERVYGDRLFTQMRRVRTIKPGRGSGEQDDGREIGFVKVVIMSATLPGPDLVAKLLGLRPEEFHTITLPSTFPAARRPFIIDPTIRVKKGMDESSLRTLVGRIDHYLSMWGNLKGIIHTHAFWLQDALLKYSTQTHRFVTHAARGLPQAVREFELAGPGTVLVSPSAHSGVDLPYDHVRFQLLMKLPSPDLGDPIIKARKQDDPDTYNLMTAATLQQMYGRGMRAADDYCTTVLVDGNGVWWLNQNRRLLSPHVQEALRIAV